MEGAPLQGVLAHVLSEMDGEDINLRDIVIYLGHRVFGPVMVLCGLFLMTPLGAIPGLPAAFGLINIAFAMQLLARRPHPWVLDILAKVRVPHARLAQLHGKVAPWLARIDNIIQTCRADRVDYLALPVRQIGFIFDLSWNYGGCWAICFT